MRCISPLSDWSGVFGAGQSRTIQTAIRQLLKCAPNNLKTVIKFSSYVPNSHFQSPLLFQLLMYHIYTCSFVTAQIRIRVGSELVTSDSKRIQFNTIYRSITGHIFRRRSHTQDRMGSRPKNDVVSIVHHMYFAILWRVQRKICAITSIPITVFHFPGTQHPGSLQSILNWTSTHPR